MTWMTSIMSNTTCCVKQNQSASKATIPREANSWADYVTPARITSPQMATPSRGRRKWYVEYRPLPVDDPTRRCPEIARARRVLGWQPEGPARARRQVREGWIVAVGLLCPDIGMLG
jgi:hypothetical protein